MAYLEPETYSENCQTSIMEQFCKNSCVTHFSAQVQKNQKIYPKNFLVFFYVSGNGIPPKNFFYSRKRKP